MCAFLQMRICGHVCNCIALFSRQTHRNYPSWVADVCLQPKKYSLRALSQVSDGRLDYLSLAADAYFQPGDVLHLFRREIFCTLSLLHSEELQMQDSRPPMQNGDK